MDDTDSNTSEIYRKMLLSLSPQKRIEMAAAMFSDSRKIVINSLQQQSLPAKNIRLELFRRFYACDFTQDECEKILAHLQTC